MIKKLKGLSVFFIILGVINLILTISCLMANYYPIAIYFFHILVTCVIAFFIIRFVIKKLEALNKRFETMQNSIYKLEENVEKLEIQVDKLSDSIKR